MRNRNVSIRPASIDDCQDIFGIISDPDVIKATFKQRKIPLDEHKTWFQMALNNPGRFLFIIEDNDKNTLGMLRFDIQKKYADVSIVLNKASRGHGYGPQALNLGCDVIYQTTGISDYRAYVRAGNIPSCKAFTKAGFVHNGTTTIEGTQAEIFVYTITDTSTNAV